MLWWLRSLIRQFVNFFSILLDVSAGICLVADRVQPGEGMALLGAALLGVSILNALFSFAQEYRAERAMEALRRLLPRAVLVRRGGVEQEVAAEDLVPGDVVVLREGHRVPAETPCWSPASRSRRSSRGRSSTSSPRSACSAPARWRRRSTRRRGSACR